MRKVLAATLAVVVLAQASAQEITSDEMILLERLRTEMVSKGVAVTPDMETRMLQRIRAMGAFGRGGPVVLETRPTPAVPGVSQPAAFPIVSEADLKSKLQALDPARPMSEVKILKDGLLVDGQRFADPEGRATRFATDAATGRVAYLVSAATPDLSTLKIARADKPAEAVTIGQLRKQGTGLQFTSVTGKSLAGDLFFPLTDGALFMRDSVGFRYVAGEGIAQINIPAGWSPAPMQRGNVSTTGWLLLEKNATEVKGGPLDIFSKLGKAVGAVGADDYSLMQLSTGKLIEIDISSDGKNAYSYSQCRRKNAVMNTCDKMTSYESAFNPDGTPNPTHYIWNIDWQRTPEGSILLAVEGLLGKRLSGVDLESGKKVALYERTLGVVMQSARVTPEGKLSLGVRLGFTTESMDDVASEIRSRPALPVSAPQ